MAPGTWHRWTACVRKTRADMDLTIFRSWSNIPNVGWSVFLKSFLHQLLKRYRSPRDEPAPQAGWGPECQMSSDSQVTAVFNASLLSWPLRQLSDAIYNERKRAHAQRRGFLEETYSGVHPWRQVGQAISGTTALQGHYNSSRPWFAACLYQMSRKNTTEAWNKPFECPQWDHVCCIYVAFMLHVCIYVFPFCLPNNSLLLCFTKKKCQ